MLDVIVTTAAVTVMIGAGGFWLAAGLFFSRTGAKPVIVLLAAASGSCALAGADGLGAGWIAAGAGAVMCALVCLVAWAAGPDS